MRRSLIWRVLQLLCPPDRIRPVTTLSPRAYTLCLHSVWLSSLSDPDKSWCRIVQRRRGARSAPSWNARRHTMAKTAYFSLFGGHGITHWKHSWTSGAYWIRAGSLRHFLPQEAHRDSSTRHTGRLLGQSGGKQTARFGASEQADISWYESRDTHELQACADLGTDVRLAALKRLVDRAALLVSPRSSDPCEVARPHMRCRRLRHGCIHAECTGLIASD